MSLEESAPVANPDVQALIADIPFREPIVDDYDSAVYARVPDESPADLQRRINAHKDAITNQDSKTDRQWAVATAASQQAVLRDPEIRRTVSEFAGAPLSEDLPVKFMEAMSSRDPRVDRLAKYTGETLGKMLALPSVPDELLVPDIRFSPRLFRPEEAADSLDLAIKYGTAGSDEVTKRLEGLQQRATERPGISDAERNLVARRYRYARDVKLIGLSAELHDQPVPEHVVPHDGLITHQLESGTKLVATEDALKVEPKLLDPTAWERRRQIKDRVYEVTVDGKPYIMKEKKTARHTDLKKNGHVDGLTSQQEFEMAQVFSELGTLQQGQIQLRWEKPLGYVEFPDGYQFTMFESEPNLGVNGVQEQLRRALLEHPEPYQAEYAEVKKQASELYWQRSDLVHTSRLQPPDWQPRTGEDELSFEEFAELKANDLFLQAEDFREETMLRQGYFENDTDGYAFRVIDGEQPALEMISFDFEYYSQEPARAAEVLERIRGFNRGGDHTYSQVSDYHRDIVHVADFAFLARRGYGLPKQHER